MIKRIKITLVVILLILLFIIPLFYSFDSSTMYKNNAPGKILIGGDTFFYSIPPSPFTIRQK
jgi:hypothetical protein